MKMIKVLFLTLLWIYVSGCSSKPEIGSNDFDSMSFVISSGDNQFAPINSNFSFPITVDVSGTTSTDRVPVYFSLAEGSAAATLSNDLVYTDSSGIASISVTSGAESGTITIVAKLTAAKDEKLVTFNLFVNGSAINWKAEIVEGTSFTAGQVVNLRISALLFDGSADSEFNGAKDLYFTSTAIASPAGDAISLPADGSYVFNNGVISADLPVTLFNSSDSGAETYTVTVSGSGLNAGNSPALTINDAAINKVRIVDADNCTAIEIDDIGYTVTISETLYAYYYDQYDNCIEGTVATGNWTKTFSDPQALFGSSPTGVHQVQFDPLIDSALGTVTFNDGTYADTTGTITLENGSADHFLITGLDSEGNYTMNAGTAVTVKLEARDINGNVAQNYDGAKALTWTSTATNLDAPDALTLAPAAPFAGNTWAPVIPTSTTYNFVDGVLQSPAPSLTLYNAAESATLTVYEGGSCGGSLCGTSGSLSVNTLAATHVLVRDQTGNAGGDSATFDATAATRTADDVYNLYCAAYDAVGNYLSDDVTADWSTSNAAIIDEDNATEMSPGKTNQSTVAVKLDHVGVVNVTCDIGGGITDSTGNFTVVPGAPVAFTIEGATGTTGGAGSCAAIQTASTAFSVPAGDAFSILVCAYDTDNHLTSNFTNAAFQTQISYVGSTSINPIYPTGVTPTVTLPQVAGTNGNSATVNLDFSGATGSATVANMRLINETGEVAGDNPAQIQVVDQDGSQVIAAGSSQNVSVVQNSLAQIVLMDATGDPSSWGGTISGPSLLATDTQVMHAVGFDKNGNFVGDQSSAWAATSGACDNLDLSATSAVSTVTYSPDTAGACIITATSDTGSFTDTTGTMIVSNGPVVNFVVELFAGGSTITAGAAYAARITAYDVDSNRVVDYNPAGITYSLTHTAGNSVDEGSGGFAPSGFTLTSGDFILGQAVISNLQIYDTSGTFTMTATEASGGSGITGTSSAITVNPNTLHHYAVTAVSGSTVADYLPAPLGGPSGTTFGVTVEARDEYGNATTVGVGANLALEFTRTADEANLGTIQQLAADDPTALSLGGLSSQSFTGFAYEVSHQVEIKVTDTNLVTAPAACIAPNPCRQTVTFTPHANGIRKYELSNFSTLTPSAGNAFSADILAMDVASNTITGVDATLDLYTFTLNSGAADISEALYSFPATYTFGNPTFTNGVGAGAAGADISYTFYSAEAVLASSFTITDGVDANRDGDAGSSDITVTADPLNHYSNETSTPTPTADGTTGFQVQLKARDQYGNVVAGDANISLGINHLTAELPGTLAGSITGINMTSGSTTISDVTYDVNGTMELTSSGGSVSLQANKSVDYVFSTSAGSLDHYELAFAGNATAGATYAITVTAKDSSNNTITNIDATLDARTFTWSGYNDSLEDQAEPGPTLPGGTPGEITPGGSVGSASMTTFSSGVATMNIVFVESTTIAISSLSVGDSFVTGTNTSSITVDSAAGDHFHVTTVGGFPSNADATKQTATHLRITLHDAFGNSTTDAGVVNAAITFNKAAGGSDYTNTGTLTYEYTDSGSDNFATGGANVNLDFDSVSFQDIHDLSYNVAHIIEIIATSGGVTTSSANSADIEFNATVNTITAFDFTLDNAAENAGTSTQATLTARDAANNAMDYAVHDPILEAINFSVTSNPNPDAPNASITTVVPAPGALTFDGSGSAKLDFTFYNEANGVSIGDLTVTTTNLLSNFSETNTDSMTINSIAGNYFSIDGVTAGPWNADAVTAQGSVSVVLRDTYGNPTIDAAVVNAQVSFQQVAGLANTGTLTARINAVAAQSVTTSAVANANLDFDSVDTVVIDNFIYNVGHEIDLLVTSGGVTTVNNGDGDFDTPSLSGSDDLIWQSVTTTVASYTVEPTDGTAVVAGANKSFTVTAYDSASNVITNDAMLNALTHTFSFTASGDTACDAPDASVTADSTVPLDAAVSFSSGVATVNFICYAAGTLAGGEIQISDSTIVDINTSGFTVNSASADHFVVQNATGFSANASGSPQGSTYVDITLKDDFGNDTTDATMIDVNLSVVQISGYANTGTFMANTLDDGDNDLNNDAIIDALDLNILSQSLDFDSVSTIRLYDISYDVGHTFEIVATKGAITTATGVGNYDAVAMTGSDDLTMIVVPATVSSYTLEPVDTVTVAASVAKNFTLSVYDKAGNAIDSDDGVLDTINFTVNINANLNGELSGTAATVPDPAGGNLTWGTGTTTLAISAFNAANGISASDVQVNDTTNSLSASNTSTYTVSPATADHITTTGLATGTADGTTTYSLLITSEDTYGNDVATGNVADSSLTLQPVKTSGNGVEGALGGSITGIDLQTNPTVTVADISYQVPHTTRMEFTTAPSVPVDTGLSTNIIWLISAASIDHYTLEPVDTSTLLAGNAKNFTLTAYDAGNNPILSEQATLDTVVFTRTINAAVDGPTSGTASVAPDPGTGPGSTLTWTAAGTTTIALTALNAVNEVSAADFRLDDTTNGLFISNTNSYLVTPNVVAAYSFEPTNATSVVAGVAKQWTITAFDTYGNNKNDGDAGLDALTHTFAFQNTNINGPDGTLASSTAPNDAAVSAFSSGVATVDVVAYNTTNGMSASDLQLADGAINTLNTSGYTVTATTLGSYTFEPTDATSIAAGADKSWTITALDTYENVKDNTDAALDALTHTFTFQNANNNGPDGTTAVSTVPNDAAVGAFSSGLATVNVKAYNITNNMSASDLQHGDGSINTLNTTGYTVVATTLASYTFEPTNASAVVSGVDKSWTITAYDTYDNLKDNTDGALDALTHTFTFQNADNDGPGGTTAASTAPNDAAVSAFSSGVATVNIKAYNSTNNMSANDLEHGDGAINTQNTSGYDVAQAALASYTIEPTNASSVVAGVDKQWTITALDTYENVKAETDAALDALTHTFTFQNANNNGPDGTTAASTAPNDAAVSAFSSGVATVNIKVYNTANSMAASDIQFGDGTINNLNTSGYTVTATTLGAYTFEPTNASSVAAGVDKSWTITALDTYENVKDNTDAALDALTHTFAFQDTDNNGPDGTTAVSTVPNDAAVSAFSSGVATVNVKAYNTTNNMSASDLQHGDGAINTLNTSGYTVTATTLASYTFEPANATAVASGADKSWTITAYDTYDNLKDNTDGALDALTHTFTFQNADNNAPDGTTAASTAPNDAAVSAFTSGVASVNVKAYNSTNNMTANDLEHGDGSINTQNTSGYDVTQAALASYTFEPTNATSVAAGVDKQWTITAYDTYDNVKADTDAALDALTHVFTFQNVNNNGPDGTTAASTAPNDAAVSAFSSGVATVNVKAYNITNNMSASDLQHGDGTINTLNTSGYTVTATTLGAYTFEPTNASSVASGVDKSWTLTALDTYENVKDNTDAALDALTHTFTFQNTNNNGPDGTTAASTAPNDAAVSAFSSGVATVNVKAYNTTNNVSASDLQHGDGTINTLNTSGYTVTATTLASYTFEPTNASSVASGVDKSWTITAFDTYENVKDNTDAALDALTHTFTFQNTDNDGPGGTTAASTAPNDAAVSAFSSGVATVNVKVYNSTNNMSANDLEHGDGSINTQNTSGYSVTQAALASYTFEPTNATSVAAGVDKQWTITAYDTYDNVKADTDAALDALTHTFTFQNANNNGPDGTTAASTAPNDAAVSAFSSGVATVNIKAYNSTNNMSANDLEHGDGTINTQNTSGYSVTQAVLGSYTFEPTNATSVAAGVDKQWTITAYDTYNNVKADTDAALDALTHTFTFQNANNNGPDGTTAASTAPNDAAVSAFSSGVATVNVKTYNTTNNMSANDLEHGDGTINTQNTSGYGVTQAALGSYTFEPTNATSVAAGIDKQWTITAYDTYDNVKADTDAALDALTHTFTFQNANNNGPDGTTAASTTPNDAAVSAFSSGVATVNVKAYNITNNMSASDLQHGDGTINTLNTSGYTVIATTLASYTFEPTNASAVASGVDKSWTITAFDTYENVKDNTDAALDALTHTFTFQNADNNGPDGTLASSTAPNDAAVSAFSSGVATVNVKAYNSTNNMSANDLEHGDGTINTQNTSGYGVTQAALGSYTFEPTNATSVAAGVDKQWTITAYDTYDNVKADTDAALDALTHAFTFQNVNNNGPDGTTAASTAPNDAAVSAFSSGVATVNVKAYNTTNDMSASDLQHGDGSINTLNTSGYTVTATTLASYTFEPTNASAVVSGVDKSWTITAYDTYDNLKDNTDGALDALTHTFTFQNTDNNGPDGTTAASTAPNDAAVSAFSSGVATVNVKAYNTTNNVSASDFQHGDGTINTLNTSGYTVTATTLASYTFEPTNASAVASGVDKSWTITAFDTYENVKDNTDAALDALTHTFTFQNADNNGPDGTLASSTAPNDAAVSAFSSGIATVNVKAYNSTNNMSANDLEHGDGSINTQNTSGYNVTQAALASYTFEPTNATSVAAGVDKSWTITAYDTYDNVKVDTDAALDALTHTFTFQNTDNNGPDGTTAASTAPNDAAVSAFSSGVATVNVKTYNTTNNVSASDLQHGDGTINTLNTSGYTVTATILGAYTFEPTNASSVAAGVDKSWTITALDTYENVKDNTDAALDALTHTFAFQDADNNGPDGTTAASTAPNDAAVSAFSSGVATVNVKAYNTTNNMSANDLEHGDGSINTQNTSGYTVTATTLASYTFEPTNASAVASGADKSWTITALDTYENVKDNTDAALDALTHTFTFQNANNNGPDGTTAASTAPNDAAVSAFSSGVATVNVKAYNSANNMTANDLEHGDGTINTLNTSGYGVTQAALASYTFEPTNATSVAAGADKQWTITAYDTYNNVKADTDAALDALTHTFTFQNTDNNGPDGTTASSTAPNDAAVSAFSSGVATVNVKAYNTTNNMTANDLEHGDGSINTQNTSGYGVTQAALASYTFEPTNATSVAAGVDKQWTITAYDTYDNVKADTDAALDALTHTFTFQNTDNNGPDGTTAASTTPNDAAVSAFSSGVATVNVKAYNTTNNMSANDLEHGDGSINTQNTSSYTVTATTLGAYTFEPTNASSVTAGVDKSWTITALDTYENVKDNTDAALDALTHTFAFQNTNNNGPDGTTAASTAPNDAAVSAFSSGVATVNVKAYNITNNMSASDLQHGDGTINTLNTSGYTVTAATLASYTFEPTNASAVASGADKSWTITAYDTYDNLKDNADGALDALTHTFTFQNAANNGPDGTLASSTAPNDAAVSAFSSGVATVNVKAYNSTNNMSANDLEHGDGSINTQNTSGYGVTQAALGSYTFEPTNASSVAAGVDKQWTITAYDTYDNVKADTDAALDALTHTFTFQNVNNNGPDGTTAASTAPNDAAVSAFSSGVATVNVKAYNTTNNMTANDLEHGDGSINTQNTSGYNVTQAALASYTFEPANATSVAAGADKQWTITAYDTYDNIKADTDAALDALTHTFTFQNTDNNGPDGTTAASTAPNDAAVSAFSSGVATVNVKVYNTTNNMSASDLQHGDGTINTLNTSGYTVTATTLASYTFEPTNASAVASGADKSWTITAYDTYDNLKDNTDAALDALTHTFTFQNADNDGPGGPTAASTAPNDAAVSAFSSGVATVNVKAYNSTNNMTANDLEHGDGSINTQNTSGYDVTQATLASYTFEPTDGTSVVAGADKQWTITAYDTYDNVKADTDAALDALTHTFTFQNINNNGPDGTTAASTAPNDAAVSAFSSGVATVNVKAYNTANNMSASDIQHGDGSINTLNSGGYTVTATTLGDYTFNPTNASAVNAGSAKQWTVTALDIYENVKDNADAALDALTHTFTFLNANNDGPDGTTATSTAPVDGGLSAFASGIATINVIAYNATNNMSSGDVQIGDGSISKANSSGYTVNPDAEDHLDCGNLVGDGQTGTVDEYLDSDSGLTLPGVLVLDQYNNPVPSVTVNFAVTGGGGSVQAASDVSSASGLAEMDHKMGTSSGTNNNVVRATGVALAGTPTFCDFTQSANPDVADHVTFTTQPAADDIIGDAFTTNPVVEIRDTHENVLSVTTAVTLTAHSDSSCLTGVVGAVADNSKAAVAGVSDFTGNSLSFNTAGTHYLKATAGSATGCSSGTIVSYANFNLEASTASVSASAGPTTFRVSGGKPPLVWSAATDASTMTLNNAVTDCVSAGHYCVDYTAGVALSNAASVTDKLEVTDALGNTYSTKVSDIDVTVNGASFSLTAGNVGYGTLAIDQQETFTITNSGSVASGAVTVTFTPDVNANWGDAAGGIDGVDTCDTNSVAGSSGTCDINLSFLGSSSVLGSKTGTITVVGTTGSATLNLTARAERADLSNTGATGVYGSTSSNDLQTFTIRNDGNISTGVLTVTFTPDVAAAWGDGVGGVDVDGCDTNTLATSGTCNIDLTFLGATAPSSAYTGTLTISDGSTANITINLTATKP